VGLQSLRFCWYTRGRPDGTRLVCGSSPLVVHHLVAVRISRTTDLRDCSPSVYHLVAALLTVERTTVHQLVMELQSLQSLRFCWYTRGRPDGTRGTYDGLVVHHLVAVRISRTTDLRDCSPSVYHLVAALLTVERTTVHQLVMELQSLRFCARA
jgi:hypothetical protein